MSPSSPSTSAFLSTLRRQYFALVPSFTLHLSSPHSLGLPSSQAFLVSEVLQSEAYPQPEKGYRRSFWRRVLSEVEKGVQGRVRVDEADDDGEDEVEVDERLYEAVAELMSGPIETSAPGPSYKTFIYDSPSLPWSRWTTNISRDATSLEETGTYASRTEGSVTLLEEQVAVQAGTTGLRTWTASLHLGHHILNSRETLFQPSLSTEAKGGIGAVIELGAGTGFLSVLLAQLGVDVIATDLGDDGDDEDGDDGDHMGGSGGGWGDLGAEGRGEDEDEAGDRCARTGCRGTRQTPLGRLRANISQNKLVRPPRVRALDWTDSLRDTRDRPRVWGEVETRLASAGRGTIVAADVVYDPDLVPALVSTINVLLGTADGGAGEQVAHPNRQALVAATVRNEETFNLFLDTCRGAGLKVTFLRLEPMDLANPTFWDTALDGGTRVEVVRITR